MTLADPKKYRYVHQILEVQNYIFENLDEDHDLQTLASIANLSAYHFHRIFTSVTGQTVKSYIRRIRLDKSALHLIYSNRAILQIALDAGFESHEAFTRAFKKQFGIAPSKYREDKVHLSANFTHPLKIESDVVMEVNIENLDPIHLAYVRHVGPYIECKAAWDALMSNEKVRQSLGPNTQVAGIGHDNPRVTDPDKIRYDACVSVPEDFKADPPVATQHLRAGRYVTVVHAGPYEKLEQTYQYLFTKYLPENEKLNLADAPCVEFYLNDPTQTKPEDLLTKVCLPID